MTSDVCDKTVMVQQKNKLKKTNKKNDQNETKTKTHKQSKIFRKNPEAVKWYLESMAPPIGARKIDGLPKASLAELLVTKQDSNSCDLVGEKSHKFGGNVSKLLKYC